MTIYPPVCTKLPEHPSEGWIVEVSWYPELRQVEFHDFDTEEEALEYVEYLTNSLKDIE